MTIYAKVSQSQLYEIIQQHDYNPFSHQGLNILIGWLFDEDRYEDDPSLINVTDLLIDWNEDDVEEILEQYNAANTDELRDKLTHFIPIPRSDRAIYKEQ